MHIPNSGTFSHLELEVGGWVRLPPPPPPSAPPHGLRLPAHQLDHLHQLLTAKTHAGALHQGVMSLKLRGFFVLDGFIRTGTAEHKYGRSRSYDVWL